jgi:hypothetical protein
MDALSFAGDTRDPIELYCAFRGGEPTIEALLDQRGLTLAGPDNDRASRSLRRWGEVAVEEA